jgi:phosphohistidine phosphatase
MYTTAVAVKCLGIVNIASKVVVMKTIFLLRHAKSSWDDDSLPDHDRPLSERGRAAAPRIGAYMRGAGYLPDLVFCSTATRTRRTLDAVLSELGVEPVIEFHEELYLAAPSEMLDLVRSVPDTVEAVLLVGHNPGTGMLAVTLSGDGLPERIYQMRAKFPTTGLAIIELSVDRWKDVVGGCGTLKEFIRPRDLP